ncbi:MAG TPA: DUF2079 domain-containing protein [Cellulomonadaceae bacterium]|nr:DUF2079 domain-containing protein [Cellulomonadaceae bacterium]
MTAAPAGSAPTNDTASRRRPLLHVIRPWVAPASIALAQLAVMATYSLTRYSQFLTAGHDLGIFDQVVRAYSRFRAPIAPLKGDGFNILGDHFHPIVALLAPLYWVWDDPRMLLLAQSALLAVSTLVVWRFTRRKLTSGWATVLTVGYALGWPLQGMINFDFHEVAFAIPLLAWAVDALDRRSDGELAAASALLLLVREDMGALVAVLGVLRALRRPRRLGVALVAGGAACLVLVTGVLIPHFSRTGHYAYWDLPGLGPDAGAALRTAVTDPGTVLRLLVTPDQKWHTMLFLVVPLLFLPLLSARSLLAVPLLAERFLSARPALWGTSFHYNAPVWIILFLSTIDVVGRLHGWRRRVLGSALAVILVLVPVAWLVVEPTQVESLLPLARLVDGSAFQTTAHIRDQSAIVARVPAGVCVVADDRLAAHLTSKDVVATFGLTSRPQDFYAIDLSQPVLSVEPNQKTTTDALDLALSTGYRVVAQAGTVMLLQSPDYAGPTAACRP